MEWRGEGWERLTANPYGWCRGRGFIFNFFFFFCIQSPGLWKSHAEWIRRVIQNGCDGRVIQNAAEREGRNNNSRAEG